MVDYMKKQVLIYSDKGIETAMILRFSSGGVIKFIDYFTQNDSHVNELTNFILEFGDVYIDFTRFVTALDKYCESENYRYSIVFYNTNNRNWTRELKNYLRILSITQDVQPNDFKYLLFKKVRKQWRISKQMKS
jgi:hypothetical protein